MVLNDSSFGAPTTSLVRHVCHFPHFIIRAFPEIQPNTLLFSDFKKAPVSSFSCHSWVPQPWTVAHLTVTSEFPIRTHLLTLRSSSPFDSEFKNNAHISVDSPRCCCLSQEQQDPNCLWAWQPERTLCQEPPWNLITFPRPYFKADQSTFLMLVKVGGSGQSEWVWDSEKSWQNLKGHWGGRASFPWKPFSITSKHIQLDVSLNFAPSPPTLLSAAPAWLPTSSVIQCSNPPGVPMFWSK